MVDEDIVRHAREMRKAGATVREIQEALNIGHGTAGRICKGIPRGKIPISEPVSQDLVSKETPAPEVEPLPGAFEQFRTIGRTLGVKEPLLTTVANYIFQLGADDIRTVHNSLKGLALRNDVTERWARLYGAFIGQNLPVPEVTGPGEDKEQHYFVIDGEVVPDTKGVYTFGQALALVNAAAKQENKQPGGIDDIERVSLIIDRLRGLFGNGNQSAPLQLKGSDGQPVLLNIGDFITLKKFENEERREEESHRTRQDMAKGAKDFMAKVGAAAARMAERRTKS